MNPTSRAMPIAFAALVAAFCFTASLRTVSGQGAKIQVVVYYESLCPDSVSFINNQLAPAFNGGLKDFLNVSLVPFGKASWITNDAGEIKFTCQHGERECQGNRAQACVLNEIEQTAGPEDQQQKMLDFVDCAMAKYYTSSAVPQCLESLGYSPSFADKMKSCSTSADGDVLLMKQGLKTQSYLPKLVVVPTILINGNDKSKDYDKFISIICPMIPQSEQYPACQ